jgi:hypothetical protein
VDIQTIQTITSAAALLIGTAYVFGGLIVNIYLSQYGVTEYQILRIKYLVVGLVFLFYVSVVVVICAVALLIIVATIPSILVQYFWLTFVISLIASLALLRLWLSGKKAGEQKWSSKIAVTAGRWLGLLSFIFPIAIFARQSLLNANDPFTIVQLFAAALVAILSLFGHLYFYTNYVYGNPEFSKLDMIGMGTPTNVQLAGPGDNLSLLGQMGIPLAQPTLTDKLALIDETDSHYIVGIGPKLQMRVFKVDKELIKGIVYLSQ